MVKNRNKIQTSHDAHGQKTHSIPYSNNIFYREDHHRTDPSYVWSSIDLVSTDPPTYHMMHFQSEFDMLNVSADCNNIRSIVSDINSQYEKGNVSEATKFDHYKNTWLPIIGALIDQWGLVLVLSDIAWAVNDVQKSIDVKTISFPPCLPYYSH